MTERWLPVVGYEGWYEVSDFGRVRSTRSKYGKPRSYLLKPRLHTRGYLRVHLTKDGKCRDHYIHSLVMEAFVGPCPPEHETNHKNGRKDTNRLDNLEYLTHPENIRHSVETGLAPVGSRHKNSKLTEGQVREIRALHPMLSPYQIAKRYGVTASIITRIVTRQGWKHVA